MHTVLSQNEKFKGSKLKTILRKILYLTQNKIIKIVSIKTIVHANFFKEIKESTKKRKGFRIPLKDYIHVEHELHLILISG